MNADENSNQGQAQWPIPTSKYKNNLKNIHIEMFLIQNENCCMLDEQLDFNFEFKEKVVSCEQKLIRKNVIPFEFKMIHLWADLRN